MELVELPLFLQRLVQQGGPALPMFSSSTQLSQDLSQVQISFQHLPTDAFVTQLPAVLEAKSLVGTGKLVLWGCTIWTISCYKYITEMGERS